MAEDRYCFLADWYDAQAAINKRFQLLYYPADNSVEMYDHKSKRQFLKKCRIDNLSPSDMFLGNTVTIMSRTMKLVDYGDNYTSRSLSGNQQKTTAVISASSLNKLGQMIDSIYKNGLKITKMRKVVISTQEAYKILEGERDAPYFSSSVKLLSEAPIIVAELLGNDARQKWDSVVGVIDVKFRLSDQTLSKLAESILNTRTVGVNSAIYEGTTCGVIKPHLVASGMAGAIIFEIQKAGFEITAIQSVNFSKANAEEFLEVYKGVVQEYPEMVEELTTGTCIAMEISKSQNAQAAFREFCGPYDPEIARALRPNTLRALFGTDKVRNGIHCTDLPEDAILEVEYFFRILDNC